jgi:ABC-type sugar transport system ATPase subunit
VEREVTVFFRPEHCVLEPRSSRRINSSNLISGRVMSKEYLGSHQLIEVEAEGERVTLDLAPQQTVADTGPLRFSVDPGHICLFPAAKS